jgi:hypothetical protein
MKINLNSSVESGSVKVAINTPMALILPIAVLGVC